LCIGLAGGAPLPWPTAAGWVCASENASLPPVFLPAGQVRKAAKSAGGPPVRARTQRRARWLTGHRGGEGHLAKLDRCPQRAGVGSRLKRSRCSVAGGREEPERGSVCGGCISLFGQPSTFPGFSPVSAAGMLRDNGFLLGFLWSALKKCMRPSAENSPKKMLTPLAHRLEFAELKFESKKPNSNT